MAKYHIKRDGTPGICHAEKGKCPLGGIENHFPTQEAAQQAADERNAESNALFVGLSAKPENSIKAKIKVRNDETKNTLAKMEKRNQTVMKGSEKALGGRSSNGSWNDNDLSLSDEENRKQLIAKSRTTHRLMTGDKEKPGDELNRLHDGISQTSNVTLSGELSNANVDDLTRQGWVYATHKNLKALAGIGGLVSKADYDNKTLAEMGETGIPKDKQGTMTTDEYCAAFKIVTNSYYIGTPSQMRNTLQTDRSISNDNVTVGELRSKINADAASENDKRSTLGAYTFARRYAMNTEKLDENQIQEISKKEGLINHVKKSVGLRRGDANLINMTHNVINSKFDIDSTKFNHRDVYNKKIRYREITEYALKTPPDKYDRTRIEKAYKYLGDPKKAENSSATIRKDVHDILFS